MTTSTKIAGNINNTDIIKEKALMVRLLRKKINRNKMDKTMGKDLRDMKNVTDESAVRVNKSLFTKSACDAYMKHYNAGSKYFYRVTLPWDDQGWRLLATDIYSDFTKEMKSYTKQYRNEVVKFAKEFAKHIEDAQTMLGDGFNRGDYDKFMTNGRPDEDKILSEFSFEVEFNTVATGEDIRASLNEVDREIIADQINKKALEKFSKANEHIVTKLQEAIFAIHERLCKEENVFRDTLISNLEEFVDIIPMLNIANDPAIDNIASRCKTMLCGWDPQHLRENPKDRKQVADDAKKILDNMDGII